VRRMPSESCWASGSRANLLFSCTLKNAGVQITVRNSKEVNAFALPAGGGFEIARACGNRMSAFPVP